MNKRTLGELLLFGAACLSASYLRHRPRKLPGRIRPVQAPDSLAADAVVVPVKVRAVAGVAPAHRSGTGGAGRGAVGIRPAGRWRPGRSRTLRLDRRPGRGRGRSRAPVAVVIARLAVGVAAVAVQSTGVGTGRYRG